jgi:hypothetical protein
MSQRAAYSVESIFSRDNLGQPGARVVPPAFRLGGPQALDLSQPISVKALYQKVREPCPPLSWQAHRLLDNFSTVVAMKTRHFNQCVASS